MSIADAFVPKKHRRQNGDPPMAGGGGSLTASGNSVTIPLRPLDSLDVLGEDAQRWFARVEQQRIAGEQLAAEVERLTKLNMRLEAELDVANEALRAVTAERNDHMNYSVAVKTRLGTVGTLILEVLDAGNQAKTPAPVVDMDAMQAAVAEGPK